MLKGKCPKCGFCCGGWALRNPENQTCPKCGAKLEIMENVTPPQDKKEGK